MRKHRDLKLRTFRRGRHLDGGCVKIWSNQLWRGLSEKGRSDSLCARRDVRLFLRMAEDELINNITKY